jgi:hypothetical protein
MPRLPLDLGKKTLRSLATPARTKRPALTAYLIAETPVAVSVAVDVDVPVEVVVEVSVAVVVGATC